jgi:hypothetical protein
MKQDHHLSNKEMDAEFDKIAPKKKSDFNEKEVQRRT